MSKHYLFLSVLNRGELTELYCNNNNNNNNKNI